MTSLFNILYKSLGCATTAVTSTNLDKLIKKFYSVKKKKGDTGIIQIPFRHIQTQNRTGVV